MMPPLRELHELDEVPSSPIGHNIKIVDIVAAREMENRGFGRIRQSSAQHCR